MNAKLHLSQTLELSDRFVDSSQSIDASQEIVHSGEVFELDELYIHLRELTTLHSTEAFFTYVNSCLFTQLKLYSPRSKLHSSEDRLT